MGIIQRQGFKSSIIGLAGVAIGALSTLFIYPKALELVGLFRSLFDAAMLIGILVLMGSSVSAVRFFPRYKDTDSGHNGLLTWLLLITGTGFLLFLLVFPFIKPLLVRYIFDQDNRDYIQVLYFLIPLTLFLALINLLSRYISNFRRITIPAIYEQLTIKVTLPLAIILFLLGWLTVSGVWIMILISYATATIGLILYLRHLGEWKLTKPVIWTDKPALKEYSRYSWYGLLSGIGSSVAFRINTLMIASFIRFEATGIYAITSALSEVINKPLRSLSAIAGPLVAHYMEEGKMEEVRSIYRKASLNMTIIGVGLFLLIWTIVPQIIEVMPNSEKMMEGRYVIFFLGLAQVWDMMTGVNSEIILYSKYYRINLYLTLLLAVINMGANFLLIPLYGLTGSAIATCISIFLYNVIKLVFIKIKYNLFPFTPDIIPAIGLGVAAWLISQWLPVTGHAYVDMVIKGAAFTLLYGIPIWKLALSPDINHWIQLGLQKARAFLGSTS